MTSPVRSRDDLIFEHGEKYFLGEKCLPCGLIVMTAARKIRSLLEQTDRGIYMIELIDSTGVKGAIIGKTGQELYKRIQQYACELFKFDQNDDDETPRTGRARFLSDALRCLDEGLPLRVSLLHSATPNSDLSAYEKLFIEKMGARLAAKGQILYNCINGGGGGSPHPSETESTYTTTATSTNQITPSKYYPVSEDESGGTRIDWTPSARKMIAEGAIAYAFKDESGRRYVGVSGNIKKRGSQHLFNARQNSSRKSCFYQALRAAPKNFSVGIYPVFRRKQAASTDLSRIALPLKKISEIEAWLIEQKKSAYPSMGYNSNRGGGGSIADRFTRPEETTSTPAPLPPAARLLDFDSLTDEEQE